MSLEGKIMAAMKSAMKNKEKEKLTALRAVKSAILLQKTSGSGAEMTEADEIKMLQKLVKSRKESLAIYKEKGREDLAAVEATEIEVIQEFLPEAMSEEDIKKVVEEVVAQVGATSMKDMGKVMGIASKKLAGSADGRVISSIVKSILG